MIHSKNGNSSDSDDGEKSSKVNQKSPKFKSSIQKNMLLAANLSARQDFLNKMLKDSEKAKNLATLQSHTKEVTKISSPPFQLKSILKTPSQEKFKRHEDTFNENETNNTSLHISFSPEFVSTQIEEGAHSNNISPGKKKTKQKNSSTEIMNEMKHLRKKNENSDDGYETFRNKSVNVKNKHQKNNLSSSSSDDERKEHISHRRNEILQNQSSSDSDSKCKKSEVLQTVTAESKHRKKSSDITSDSDGNDITTSRKKNATGTSKSKNLKDILSKNKHSQIQNVTSSSSDSEDKNMKQNKKLMKEKKVNKINLTPPETRKKSQNESSRAVDSDDDSDVDKEKLQKVVSRKIKSPISPKEKVSKLLHLTDRRKAYNDISSSSDSGNENDLKGNANIKKPFTTSSSKRKHVASENRSNEKTDSEEEIKRNNTIHPEVQKNRKSLNESVKTVDSDDDSDVDKEKLQKIISRKSPISPKEVSKHFSISNRRKAYNDISSSSDSENEDDLKQNANIKKLLTTSSSKQKDIAKNEKRSKEKRHSDEEIKKDNTVHLEIWKNQKLLNESIKTVDSDDNSDIDKEKLQKTKSRKSPPKEVSKHFNVRNRRKAYNDVSSSSDSENGYDLKQNANIKKLLTTSNSKQKDIAKNEKRSKEKRHSDEEIKKDNTVHLEIWKNQKLLNESIKTVDSDDNSDIDKEKLQKIKSRKIKSPINPKEVSKHFHVRGRRKASNEISSSSDSENEEDLKEKANKKKEKRSSNTAVDLELYNKEDNFKLNIKAMLSNIMKENENNKSTSITKNNNKDISSSSSPNSERENDVNRSMKGKVTISSKRGAEIIDHTDLDNLKYKTKHSDNKKSDLELSTEKEEAKGRNSKTSKKTTSLDRKKANNDISSSESEMEINVNKKNKNKILKPTSKENSTENKGNKYQKDIRDKLSSSSEEKEKHKGKSVKAILSSREKVDDNISSSSDSDAELRNKLMNQICKEQKATVTNLKNIERKQHNLHSNFENKSFGNKESDSESHRKKENKKGKTTNNSEVISKSVVLNSKSRSRDNTLDKEMRENINDSNDSEPEIKNKSDKHVHNKTQKEKVNRTQNKLEERVKQRAKSSSEDSESDVKSVNEQRYKKEKMKQEIKKYSRNKKSESDTSDSETNKKDINQKIFSNLKRKRNSGTSSSDSSTNTSKQDDKLSSTKHRTEGIFLEKKRNYSNSGTNKISSSDGKINKKPRINIEKQLKEDNSDSEYELKDKNRNTTSKYNNLDIKITNKKNELLKDKKDAYTKHNNQKQNSSLDSNSDDRTEDLKKLTLNNTTKHTVRKDSKSTKSNSESESSNSEAKEEHKHTNKSVISKNSSDSESENSSDSESENSKLTMQTSNKDPKKRKIKRHNSLEKKLENKKLNKIKSYSSGSDSEGETTTSDKKEVGQGVSSTTDSESENEKLSAKTSSKHLTPSEQNLRQFQDQQKDLHKVKMGKTDNFPDITSDDEVFLLKIPKGLGTCLLGKQISLTSETKVKSENNKLICVPNLNINSNTNSFLNVMVHQNNRFQVKSLKLSGKIMVHEEIKEKKLPNFDGFKENSVEFPDNLKFRHPLFGTDYSRKVKLDERIENKLREPPPPIKSKSKKHKKSKKHEKRVNEQEMKAEQDEVIFKYLKDIAMRPESNAKSEHRKKKHKSDKDVQRKKKHKNDEDISNSLEYFEGNDLGEYTPTNRKRKHKSSENISDILEDLEHADLNGSTSKKKKKKKRKLSQECFAEKSEKSGIFDESLKYSEDSHTKKNKKSKHR